MKYIIVLIIFLVALFSLKVKRSSSEKNNEVDDINEQVKFQSYKEKRTLQETFESLKLFYNNKYPEISGTLNTGASKEEIKELEEALKRTLPAEFKQLYLIANGQRNEDKPFFQNGYEFLNTKGIIYHWNVLNKIYNSETHFQEIESNSGAILETWWQPEWIPFAEMMNGDLYCIDLKSGESGRVGQIIEFIHDDYIRNHLGESLNDFLGELDFGLRSGSYFMNKEYGIITSKD